MNKIFLLLLVVSSFLTTTGKAQTFYKTPSGQKYHIASCRMVNNVSQKITTEQIATLGLEACKICNPSAPPSALMGATKKANGEKATVQCKGITKAGTRCRHRTSIANGFCYQHNPDN